MFDIRSPDLDWNEPSHTAHRDSYMRGCQIKARRNHPVRARGATVWSDQVHLSIMVELRNKVTEPITLATSQLAFWGWFDSEVSPSVPLPVIMCVHDDRLLAKGCIRC